MLAVSGAVCVRTCKANSVGAIFGKFLNLLQFASKCLRISSLRGFHLSHRSRFTPMVVRRLDTKWTLNQDM